MKAFDRPQTGDPTGQAPGADPSEDPRLLQAVQEYMDELEVGRRPSRQDFMRRYPDLAQALARCLDGLDLVHQAAAREKASSPGGVALGARPAESLTATPIGDFQIVREIGRGGMGIVYEAVQLSLGRRVALKVLPFAATFDPKHLQRFRNEAHAAAQLHHTNIVPVYTVGAERGVHFYAMQLIEGQSLAVLVQQLRQQAGRPPTADRESWTARPQPPAKTSTTASPAPPDQAGAADTVAQLAPALSTQRSASHREFFRSAARLMVQAAEALEHAHQLGIIHRDVKPANLLVDVHARLWITDFGLAQLHADAGLTQTGDVLGTLRYMSPEQAAGKRTVLDHRTDVYALGATLYELVTLEPIFPGQNRQELLHQVIHDEPRAPRAVAKAVPVELETIILKAVSKSPSDRYGSARELADDLQRFLEDKPIRARRPSLVERARKWSRRHPSFVAGGVLLLLVCIAGLLVNNRMIADEQANTAAALEREQQRAEEAEKRFRQARETVDVLVDVCEEELADLPHLERVRQRLLEMAVGYYRDFMEQRQGDAGAQAELAAGETRVRRLLDELAILRGDRQLVCVADPAVQKDLGLKDEQRTQVGAMTKRWWEQQKAHFRRGWELTAKARYKNLVELARAHEKELHGILDAPQRKRLRQIALQLQGPQAFQQPEIVAALMLTTDQQQRIRRIEEKMFTQVCHGPTAKGEGPDRRKHPGEVGRETVQQIVALLTAPQVQRWQDLTGAPFRAERPFGPPRFLGPHGPPGPPGPP
jgi:serine/threonine protein kinase